MADPDSNTEEATEILASFVAGTRAADIPDGVMSLMQQCLLDFLGNSAFAAAKADSTPAIRKGLVAFCGDAGGDVTVIGEARQRPLPLAVLLNGTYAHSMDFDDTNIFGIIHPGATIIPAALAEAEQNHASGTDLLAAIAVGYEIGCRVGAALGEAAYQRGFHPTPIGGIFGAVAAIAHLRGLDADTVCAAFGLAGSRVSGSMQYLENGAWNKRLHTGFAAHDAVMVTTLAEAGVTGSAKALEGRAGVLACCSPEPDATHLTDRLGTFWAAAQTAIKPYPCCRLTHSPIDAALVLRPQIQDLATARFELRFDATSYRLVGEAIPGKLDPRNIVDGQFSVYFHVAVALLSGRNDWSSYELMGDPKVRDLASRITVISDADMKVGQAVLSVTSEQIDPVSIQEPLGEPGRPLGWTGVLAKYTDLAAGVLGANRAAELAEGVRTIRDTQDIAPLVALAGRPQ